MDIGSRVRSLRQKRGLTLEELASRSELTKGFLSQLERNLTSPSISTLEDITEVLGISLQDFFKEEKEEKISFKASDLFVDEKEESRITWLIPTSQNNEMEPILLELKPGGCSNEVREHEGEEFGYILKGKVVLENLTNGESYILRKGDSFSLKGEFSHRIVNKAEHDASLIWICTPPIF